MGLLDFIIKVGVDASGVRKGTDDIKEQFSAMSGVVGAKLAAAFSVGAVAAYAQRVAGAALETKKLAEQLDTTTEMLERMQKIASKKGLSDEFFPKAIIKMQTFMNEALTDEKKQKILEGFGLAFSDIAGEGANAAEAIEKVGRAIANMNLTNDQRAFLTQMFGKQGSRGAGAVAALPDTQATLSRGQSEAITKLGEAFEEVGKTSARMFLKGFAWWAENTRDATNFIWDKMFGTSFGVKTHGASGNWNQTPDNPVEVEKAAKAKKEADEAWEDYLRWAMTPESAKRARIGGGSFDRTETDELARIGGFLGSGTGISPNVRLSLNYQERTARAVEDIRTKVDEGATQF